MAAEAADEAVALDPVELDEEADEPPEAPTEPEPEAPDDEPLLDPPDEPPPDVCPGEMFADATVPPIGDTSDAWAAATDARSDSIWAGVTPCCKAVREAWALASWVLAAVSWASAWSSDCWFLTSVEVSACCADCRADWSLATVCWSEVTFCWSWATFCSSAEQAADVPVDPPEDPALFAELEEDPPAPAEASP